MLSAETVNWLIKAGVIAVAVLAVILIVRHIMRRVSRTVNSAEARAVRTLINTVAENGFDFDSNENEPRKISNMNKIYLPKILKDFPDFNWGETRRSIEQAIRDKYAGKKAFTIYDTAIARYEALGKDIFITTQSAASYQTEEGVKQLVVQCTLSYITYQEENTPNGIRALNCPNCGAVLRRNPAGELVCEYCGTAVTGERDWQLTEMKKNNKNKKEGIALFS